MDQEANNSIIIYKTPSNDVELEVHLEKESVWLTQAQMALLFGKSSKTISEHIHNIYAEGELSRNPTIRNYQIVRLEHNRRVFREIEHYNLDVIISVGYRVKSLQGTQFRIWATNILRKYLVQGYAVNKQRLEQESQRLYELQTQLRTLRKVIDNESFSLDESKELVRIITDYASGLELLDQVDNNQVKLPQLVTKQTAKEIEYESIRVEIDRLREELKASDLFGNEKDNGFKSALKTIFQTFGGKELYPSIEEKAANLLYLVIKNHPFSDGNKRIGAFTFLRFLDVNGLLYKENQTRLVEENALVAIALLVAQSDPKDKELMVRLIVNLLVI